jgi:hypothetical protein
MCLVVASFEHKHKEHREELGICTNMNGNFTLRRRAPWDASPWWKRELY